MSTKTAKWAKIVFWISTIALALFILPGIFFMNSEMAKQWMAHVWLTDAIRLQQLLWPAAPLAILIILIPGVWNRLKEWAYVWLGLIYIGAFWAHLQLGDPIAATIMPLITFAVLLTSYLAWHKILKAKGQTL